MTLSEAIYELWRLAGSSTDLDPTNGTTEVVVNTTFGAQRLAKILTWAQDKVSTWKDPRVRGNDSFWWSGKTQKKIFTLTPYLFTGLTPSSPASLNLTKWDPNEGGSSNVPTEDVTNELVGWLNASSIEELRRIVSYDTTNKQFTLYPAMTSTGIGKQVSVYRRWFDLPSTYRIINIHQVFLLDLTTGESVPLDKAVRGDMLTSTNISKGVPTTWWYGGRRVFLDIAVPVERVFEVVIERLPGRLDTPVDVGGGVLGIDLGVALDLPEQTHQAVIYYALGWAMGLQMETEMQAWYQNKFQTEMDSTTDEMYSMNQLDQNDNVTFGE